MIVPLVDLEWRVIAKRKAPCGGRLSTGCRSRPWHWGGDRIGCLWFRNDLSGAWQVRKGITSQGRDARSLAFSAVIPARVWQLRVSTRRNQTWQMAHCNYGMAIATCHHVDRWFHASWAYLRFGHRLQCSLAGLCWRVRVGLATGPPLNFKVALFSGDGVRLECLFPYPPGTQSAQGFAGVPNVRLSSALRA